MGSAISSIFNGIGASQAAAEQQKYQDMAMGKVEDGYNNAINGMTPYETAGRAGLAGLAGLAGKPLDRNALLGDYFNGQEYKTLADQARYQQLAAAEATGGLGASATANGLASIAPTLGQNYLNDMVNQQQTQYSQLMGLSGLGFKAANLLGQYNINKGNALGGMTQQLGGLAADKASIPWKTASGAYQGALNDGYNVVSMGRFGGLI